MVAERGGVETLSLTAPGRGPAGPSSGTLCLSEPAAGGRTGMSSRRFSSLLQEINQVVLDPDEVEERTSLLELHEGRQIDVVSLGGLLPRDSDTHRDEIKAMVPYIGHDSRLRGTRKA